MYKQYNAEYDIWSEKAADGVVNAVSLRNEVLKTFEEMYISYKEASKDDKYKIPDKDLKKLEENSGYCPCKIVRNEDTKCMCKEFKEQEEGMCHCGLYYKTKD